MPADRLDALQSWIYNVGKAWMSRCASRLETSSDECEPQRRASALGELVWPLLVVEGRPLVCTARGCDANCARLAAMSVATAISRNILELYLA